MATAVLIITLLTVAASLASWLFSQWLARRIRVSGVALAVGGGGTVLLLGAVALVIVGASTWWQRLMPVQDLSALLAPAPTSARSNEIANVEPQPMPEPEPEPQAEQYLADQVAGAIEAIEPEPIWQDEPAAEPGPRATFDEPKEAMLARALFAAEHPGPAAIIPAAVVAEWPATDCVASTRSDESARWILDNGCGRVVAVLFASCQFSETACFTNALVSQGWSYEPAGILMTAGNDKPVPLRLGKAGPLVAPIFTIRDPAGVRRQIRYLACEVTAPGALQVLRISGGDEERLAAELRADACYSQVLDWTRSGQRQGKSPDALLRRGID